MRLEKIQRANGPVWRVRWRDEQAAPDRGSSVERPTRWR